MLVPPKGEMLSVFLLLYFLCLVRCLLPFFAVLLFLGSLFEKIFGGELLFLGVGVGFVFFGGFLPMFLLHFWRFAPESAWNKILLMSGLLFFMFVLSSFGFFVVVVVVVFPFLGTQGGKGFLVFLLPCFLFPLVFCGHTFSRKPG